MRRPSAAASLIAILLIFLLTCLALAGPNEDATKAFERRDINTVKALAEKGDAKAQFWLAITHSLGLGVPVDHTEAVKWLRKSAEQGEASAQELLGGCYAEGIVLPQDNTEAFKWFRKAAEQGECISQSELAEIYYSGTNYPEAAKWWRKAAEQGYSDAQYNLGLLYNYGRGVPQDLVLAHMWLNLAAMQSRGLAAEDRERVASQMTPEQIAEAERLAQEWILEKER